MKPKLKPGKGGNRLVKVSPKIFGILVNPSPHKNAPPSPCFASYGSKKKKKKETLEQEVTAGRIGDCSLLLIDA